MGNSHGKKKYVEHNCSKCSFIFKCTDRLSKYSCRCEKINLFICDIGPYKNYFCSDSCKQNFVLYLKNRADFRIEMINNEYFIYVK